MAHDVFISHSSKDKPIADAACATLEARGVRCWIAPRDILPGQEWAASIVEAINACRVMALIFSNHANESHQIKLEVERAVSKGVPVLPFRIENVPPTGSMEYFLSTPHWLDALTPPLEDHLVRLAETIRTLVSKLDEAQAEEDSGAGQRGSRHAGEPSEAAIAKAVQATENALRTNLPQPLTSFIGRETEIEELRRLLPTTRLLTVTGTGGTGKTRLALKVAADLIGEYPDGVWLAELAPVSDPDLVSKTVAQVLGVKEQPGSPILEMLLEALKLKTLLLVLDNCEHLIEACAQLAQRLLQSCPRLRILATSQEPMGFAGETPWRIPTLSLPDPENLPPLENLMQYGAVRLFVERAQGVKPGFAITDQNAAALVRLCARLDGIPLALELAAARVKVLTVEQIEDRLDDRFRLLTSGARTALPRQQTLRALIDWSYSLLVPEERILLRRLSVFAGGWVLEAAEAVCTGEYMLPGSPAEAPAIKEETPTVEDWEVLDLLTGLVDKSLVLEEEQNGVARYRLLETIRQYGRDRLEESGESAVVRAKHRNYLLQLAEEAEPHLVRTDQLEWLERLEAERGNLRAALDWCEESVDDPAAWLRLVGALWRYWEVRSHLMEGRERLCQVLGRPETQAPTLERVKALRGAGVLEMRHGGYAEAQARFEESLTIARTLGNQAEAAVSMNFLALVARSRNDFAAAKALLEESLTILRALGDKRGIALNLGNLGNIASDEGDYATARSLQEQCVILLRELGDQWFLAIYLWCLAMVALHQEDHATARAALTESTRINIGLEAKGGIAYSLEGFATLAASENKLDRATRLFAAEETLRKVLGAPLRPSEQTTHLRAIEEVRGKLSGEVFQAVWEEGSVMSPEKAIAYALEDDPA